MTAPGVDALTARFRDMVPVGCVPLSGVRLLRFLEPDGSESIRLVRHFLDGDDAMRFKISDGDAVAATVGSLLLASLGYAQPDEGAA